MGGGAADFGAVLARRLADIAAAAARYDAFAFTEGPAPPDGDPEGLGGEDAARDLALAALRTAGDPLAYAMLRRLAAGDAPLAELTAVTGLPRLAVWERQGNNVVYSLRHPKVIEAIDILRGVMSDELERQTALRAPVAR